MVYMISSRLARQYSRRTVWVRPDSEQTAGFGCVGQYLTDHIFITCIKSLGTTLYVICVCDNCKGKVVCKIGSHGGDFGLDIFLIEVDCVYEDHIPHYIASLNEVRFSKSTWLGVHVGLSFNVLIRPFLLMLRVSRIFVKSFSFNIWFSTFHAIYQVAARAKSS